MADAFMIRPNNTKTKEKEREEAEKAKELKKRK
jgi:hypothetical protein